MGVAAVDAKIAARPALEAMPEPEAEKDDGHEETVEEVKIKMAAAQAAMDEGLANVDKKAEQANMMPDMSALTNVASSFHRMGLS